MAPLESTDTNRTRKSLSRPKGDDASSTNKENFSLPLKSVKKSQANTSRAIDKKRPAENAEPTVLGDASSSNSSSDEGMEKKWNCNQICSRITTYIEGTDTTQKDFQSRIEVSADSFRGFMRLSGPHAGSGDRTYVAAHRHFSEQEAKGLRMPRKPAQSKSAPSKSSKKSGLKKDEDKFDVSKMSLDHEKGGRIPTYDTCNDVRTKTHRHLRVDKVTQAGLARTISACQGEDESPVQSRQVADFSKKSGKGPMAGNTSKAYYAAYVFFENLRVKQSKKKTKKREEMEIEYDHKGVPRDYPLDGKAWTTSNEESPYVDNLGRVNFERISRN